MPGESGPKAAYPPHPLAQIVPRMSDDEYLDLRKSIREFGLLEGEEIVLHEGKILDGRHRYDACLREGVEPRFREYSGGDPEGYVLAKLTRRNLDESTRALVAGRLLVAREGRGGDKLRQDDVRRRFGVGGERGQRLGHPFHPHPRLKDGERLPRPRADEPGHVQLLVPHPPTGPRAGALRSSPRG